MPAPAGVLAPLLLAGVLVVSALAKWRQPASTVSAIRLLRLPGFLHNTLVAKGLPLGEVALALLMLAPWVAVARVASWAALALFVAYLVVIARAMTFDPRPSCGCFGNIGDQTVRAKTVWRNVLFVALAGVFVWFAAAGHTVPSVLGSMGATGWAWLIGSALVTAAVVLIGAGATGTPAARHARDHRRDDAAAAAPGTPGTPGTAGTAGTAGTQGAAGRHDHSEGAAAGGDEDLEEYERAPIPMALLLDPERQGHLLTEMVKERAQLLVFVNCYCGPTYTAARAVPGYRERLPEVDVRLIFTSVAPMASTEDTPTNDAWTDPTKQAWTALGLDRSPSAVLLGADGLLAGGPVDTTEEIDAFVDEIEAVLAGARAPSAQ